MAVQKQTKRRREIKWWHSYLPCCKPNDDIGDLKKEVEMVCVEGVCLVCGVIMHEII